MISEARTKRHHERRMFNIFHGLTVAQIYAQAEEELRNEYVLGYTSTPADTGAGYHRIHSHDEAKRPDRSGAGLVLLRSVTPHEEVGETPPGFARDESAISLKSPAHSPIRFRTSECLNPERPQSTSRRRS